VTVDGAVVADTVSPVPADPVHSMTRPDEVRTAVGLQAGQEAEIRLDFQPASGVDAPLSVRLGIAADQDEDAMIAEAVQEAAAPAPPRSSARRRRPKARDPTGRPWPCPDGRTSWSPGWPR